MKIQITKFCLTLILLLGNAGEIFAQGEWFPTDKPNCLTWNPNPSLGETVTWSGDCVNGKAHGTGKTTWRFKQSGIWVERYINGDMLNGQRSGQVKITYENGDLFIGTLDADGNRIGQGTYYFSRGGRYVGDWKDDQKNGQGDFIFSDGSKYVGQFKDDNMNGQGTYNYTNGNKYVGEWKDGKSNGQGIYTFGLESEWAGDTYVGQYKDNKSSGQGTYTSADGHKYVGQWKDGKVNGIGTETYVNGDKYVGEYKIYKRNGQGTYTFADGTAEEGIWKDGKLQHEKTPSKSASVAKTGPKDEEVLSTSSSFGENKIFMICKTEAMGERRVANGTTFHAEIDMDLKRLDWSGWKSKDLYIRELTFFAVMEKCIDTSSDLGCILPQVDIDRLTGSFKYQTWADDGKYHGTCRLADKKKRLF